MYETKANNASTLSVPFLILTDELIVRPIVHYDRQKIFQAVSSVKHHMPQWFINHSYDLVVDNFYKEVSDSTAMHYVVYRNDTFIGMVSISHYECGLQIKFWFVEASYVLLNNMVEGILCVIKYYQEECNYQIFYLMTVDGHGMCSKIAKCLDFSLYQRLHTANQNISIFTNPQNYDTSHFNYKMIKNK